VLSADGSDCYAAVKEVNRFKVVKRTKGVSTTDLVGRMLLLTKTHWVKKDKDGKYMLEPKKIEEFSVADGTKDKTRVSNFFATANKIVQFSSGKEPKLNDKIVYIDGAFDLFHVGHVDILKAAKEQGDYLVVGLLDDETVNRYLGGNLPIMNLHERALSVLSCRYVDEVVIGAPLDITKEMIDSLRINVVVAGKQPHSYGLDRVEGYVPYKVPKELGVFCTLESGSTLTTTQVIKRIIANHAQYEARNKQKEEKERAATGGQTFTN
jgi:ethanolamine-phosphate cytidylyltransferase